MKAIRKPTQKEINNHVPVEEPSGKHPDPKIKPPAGTPNPEIENPNDPRPLNAPPREDHAKIQDPKVR